MSDYYGVHMEGAREAWSNTPGATGADWDQALAEAKQRATERDRNYVVRHNSREGSRVIVTATPNGEVHWPRQASPVVDLGAEQEMEA